MYRTLLAPLAALTLAGTALAQDAPPELPRLSAALKDLRGARARLSKLADLIDAAPPEGGPRALVLVGAEQIASEMLGDRKVLADIAVHDAAAFTALADKAKDALAA